jgi:hypothetical protein
MVSELLELGREREEWRTMAWKPDVVHTLPDGSQEQIRYRRAFGQRGERSRIRKVLGPDGRTREVWHEVLDGQGNLIHTHRKL